MALILNLIPTGPGLARIDIEGTELPESNLEFAVQRSSDTQYVGDDATWQPTACWHPLRRADGEAVTPFTAGPEIVDALAEVSRNDSFRVLLRWEGSEAQVGALRIHGELLASAGLKPPPPRPKAAPPPPPEPGPKPVVTGPPQQPSPSEPNTRKQPTWPWIAGAAMLLIALGLGAWQLGWLAPQTVDENADIAAPPETAAEEPPLAEQERTGDGQGPDAEQGLGPETEVDDQSVADQGATADDQKPDVKPELTPMEPETKSGEVPKVMVVEYPNVRGIKLVDKVLDDNLNAREYFDLAQRRAQREDCDAAILLYDLAAKDDADIAGEVAGLYDPRGFLETPCIDTPSRANALEYYELAAEGGIPHAQRRLGQMLIEGQNSGPDYTRGLDLLREAAANDDLEALEILDRLGSAAAIE